MNLYDNLISKGNLSVKRTKCKANIELVKREIENLQNDLIFYEKEKKETLVFIKSLEDNKNVLMFRNLKQRIAELSSAKNDFKSLLLKFGDNNKLVESARLGYEELRNDTDKYYKLKNDLNVKSFLNAIYKVQRIGLNEEETKNKIIDANKKLSYYENKYEILTKKIRNAREEIIESLSNE